MTLNSSVSCWVSSSATLFTRAIECAGIDDPCPAHSQIMAHVGVAVEQVIIILPAQQLLLQRKVISMNHGEALVIQREVGEFAVAFDAK